MAKNDSLAKYKAKRDFAKTAEPKGILGKSTGNRFLIQKHAASHLHYDFRLELDGVLKSWAVPKGPSSDPNDRRLAMQVEDHPVAYGSFEGIIPKGEYGGGTVMLWDEGTWEPVGDARRGLAKGKLVFQVYGKRVKGEWTLVKTFSKDKHGNGWLLIKHHDEEESLNDKGALVDKNLTSVISGRTMEEIAADGDKVWKSNREEKTQKPVAKLIYPVKKTAIDKKASGKGRNVKMPDFTPPQLATLSSAMPKGAQWVHEIKFDGYRMLSYIDNGHVTIYSRNGKDWTDAFKIVADRLEKFSVQNAILDGELVVTDKAGKSNFSELKNALSNGETQRFQYYVFDLLYLNGKSLIALPLRERKELLRSIIEENAPKSKSQHLFFSDHFTDDADHFLQSICSLQLEGVVSKHIDAPYHAGRSKIWLKTKCQKRQEFVIGGFTLPSNGSKGVASLLLGYYDKDKNLVYSGRVGTGFTNESSLATRKKLDRLIQKENSFYAMKTEGRRGAKWVKPQLVAEVEFSEWTPDGHLRHPSFKGLREDKPAKDIVREVAVSPKSIAREIEKEVTEDKKRPVAKAKPKISAKKGKVAVSASSSVIDKDGVMVGGIRISHPDRVIYPDSQTTKRQLAEYYLSVADHILPHVVDRPLSMLRCPEGIAEPCFFQRHIGLGQSPHLHEVSVTVKKKARDYLMIHGSQGLLSLVQWGCIELHPWQCAAGNLANPDRIIFDLDPDPAVKWRELMEGAHEVKQRMEELGLQTFLKTTGGKGLHVVVPITPVYSFTVIKSFARLIAESMAHDSPGKYLSTMSKTARKGKIFVDYLRNDVTSTAVAPFSARAREGATVSTPIAWAELTPTLKPAFFTIETVPERLRRQKSDPWKDFSKTRQKISAKYLKALQIKPE